MQAGTIATYRQLDFSQQHGRQDHSRRRRANQNEVRQKGNRNTLSLRMIVIDRSIAKRVIRMRMSNRPPRKVMRMDKRSG